MSSSLIQQLRLAVLCAGVLLGTVSWSFWVSAKTIGPLMQAANFNGQLTAQHDTWNRMTTINVSSGQQVFFETTHVRIQNSGQYTINLSTTGFAPSINVFGGAFFPATPQVNFWDNGVVTGTPGNLAYQVFLAGGQQFDIVVSTNLAGQTGTYTASIIGPGPVTIDPPPPLGILSNPLDTTITPGQTATLLVTTSGRAPKTFQWFQGLTGDTSNPLAGGTSASFITPALFADTSYWVRVSSASGTVDSGTATVFVTNGPITYSNALTPCDDRTQNLPFKLFRFRVSTAGSYSFRLDTNGFRGRLRLYQGGFLPGSPNVNLFGSSALGTSVTLSQSLLVDGNIMHLVILPENATTLGTFTVTVTNGPAFVTKLPAPEITVQPQSANVARNLTPTLSVGTNSLNVSYQWFSGNCQSNSRIAGATGASFTLPPVTNDQSLFVRLDSPGGYFYSSIAALTVTPFAGNLNFNPQPKNQRVEMPAPGVLNNATGPAGRTLTAQKVSDPAHGTLSLSTNGAFVYQPAFGYVGPDSFTFRVSDGVRLSNTATVNFTMMPSFTNGTSNTIPTSGPAAIYPSIINISGLTGNINKLIVTLVPQQHANQGDLDILLVGPQGQAMVLLSDANGDPDNPFLFNRILNFDDAATDTIFDGRALFDGTYRPVNFGGGDSFPTPAPTNFQSPAPAGTATLASVFNGTDPNGDWKLFIFDDQGGSDGSLASWSLTIGTGAACPQFTVTPPTLPEVLINTPFPATTFAASGGEGVYSFELTGTLPNGMTFTPHGVLSGTPTQSGLFPFSVTAKDQNNCTWQRAYTLNVTCPVIQLRLR